MLFTKLYADQRNRTSAEEILHICEIAGHPIFLHIISEPQQTSEIQEFFNTHSDSSSQISFLIDSSSINSLWLKKNIEYIADMLEDNDSESLKRVSFIFVTKEAEDSFQLHGEGLRSCCIEAAAIDSNLVLANLELMSKSSKKTGQPAPRNSITSISKKHKEFVSTILNNSRAATFLAAAAEWAIERLGYIADPQSCQVCGRKINYFAVIVNNKTKAKITIGQDCLDRLLAALTAENITTVFASKQHYLRQRRQHTLDKILSFLSATPSWQIRGLDYGSWRTWFLQQADADKLPKNLAGGVKELRDIGVLGTDELVTQFVAYHNENRKFPSSVLLPYSRVYNFTSQEHSIPNSVTVNEASQLAVKLPGLKDVGNRLIDRLQKEFKCGSSANEIVRLSYNFLLVIGRGFWGANNDAERLAFLTTNRFFQSGKAPQEPNNGQASVTKEFRAFYETIASTLLLAIDDLKELDEHGKILLSRIHHISYTGRISFLWPLSKMAPYKIPPATANGSFTLINIKDLSQLLHSTSASHGHTLTKHIRLMSSDLTTIAKEQVSLVENFLEDEIQVSAGWIAVRACSSNVLVSLGRYSSRLELYVSEVWKDAPKESLAALFRVIARDVGQRLHVRADIAAVYDFLSSIDLVPISHRNLAASPGQPGEESGIDIEAAMKNAGLFNTLTPPRIIRNNLYRSPKFFRWSNVLFLPATKTSSATLVDLNRRTRFLAQHGSLRPASFENYRNTFNSAIERYGKSLSKDEAKSIVWFALTKRWVWPQQDENTAENRTLAYLGTNAPLLYITLSWPNGKRRRVVPGMNFYLTCHGTNAARFRVYYSEKELNNDIKGIHHVLKVERDVHQIKFVVEKGESDLSLGDQNHSGEKSMLLDCGSPSFTWRPFGLTISVG